MNVPRFLFPVIAVTLLVGGVIAVAAENVGDGTKAEPAAQLPDASPKSVTVFPVVIKPEMPAIKTTDGTEIDFGRRVATVLGLFLEKAGIENIELAAIQQRFQAAVKKLRTATFAVYPVRIGSDTDKQCAAELVQMLNKEKICRAVAADADVRLQIEGDPNQQKVLWDTARAFRDFVRKNPPAEDYAVFADYGIGRSVSGKTKVGHVHVIVCDRAGDWVIVDFQNSHHPDFQAIRPRSRADCNRLVVRRAKGMQSGE